MERTFNPQTLHAAYRGVGWRILALSGFLLVGTLYLVDPIELLSFFATRIVYLTADSANQDVSSTNSADSGQLFGLDTEPVADGALSDKWRRAKADINKDLEIIAQCRASKSCSGPAQKLVDISREGESRSGRVRVGRINRAVDLAIHPISDETQWGVPDHWSGPLETLSTTAGDCEDYAIVKYAALLAAGLSSDAVKIVILRNLLPSEDHAVVAVRADGRWLILDNRTLALIRDTDVTRATPKFVLDNHGVRRFVGSGRKAKSALAAARSTSALSFSSGA